MKRKNISLILEQFSRVTARVYWSQYYIRLLPVNYTLNLGTFSHTSVTDNKVKLTVTYDMGCQKRSSGSRYDSCSGHSFIIGVRSKGLGKNNHSNDTFASTTNDEGMPSRWVISTIRWSLLTAHIICNSKFNLVFIFPLYDRAHHSIYDWLLCSSASFILFWRASSIAKYFTSCSSMPAFISTFVNVFFRILAKVDSESPRALLIQPPPPTLHASHIDRKSVVWGV